MYKTHTELQFNIMIQIVKQTTNENYFLEKNCTCMDDAHYLL